MFVDQLGDHGARVGLDDGFSCDKIVKAGTRNISALQQYSTVFWAGMLVFTAWLIAQVTFVLNAAFSLRGLTAGALLGSLMHRAFSGGRLGPTCNDGGMIASLVTMNFIYWPANIPSDARLVDENIRRRRIWPWFNLSGTCITLGVAWVRASDLAGGESTPDKR